MKSPDARLYYNSSPDYLRALIAQAGISQNEAARRLGVSPRAIRYWLAGDQPCPYSGQVTLELLAATSHPV